MDHRSCRIQQSFLTEATSSAGFTRLILLLYGIRPTDPLTFAAMSGLLLLVGIAASSVPAFRAARVDPMNTLRDQ
jgi:ABC-type lipoprotein release transport system permease subunit